jgi:ATP-dependent DNA helicase PIF1
MRGFFMSKIINFSNSNSPNLDELSLEQSQVIAAFETGKNIFVTGGAGSGKSYLLNLLKRNYGQYGLEITASTGIAAVNIGGSTIHAWSGIGLANLPIDQIVKIYLAPKQFALGAVSSKQEL